MPGTIVASGLSFCWGAAGPKCELVRLRPDRRQSVEEPRIDAAVAYGMPREVRTRSQPTKIGPGNELPDAVLVVGYHFPNVTANRWSV